MNKTNSCVVLRWNLVKSKSIDDALKETLQKKLSTKMTENGEIIFRSQRFRDRSRNVADALEKLRALLLKAAHVPKKRRATKVPRGAKEKRLTDKKSISEKKRQRREKF